MEFFEDVTAMRGKRAFSWNACHRTGSGAEPRFRVLRHLRSMASCRAVTISGKTTRIYRCISRDAARNEATVLEKDSGERCSLPAPGAGGNTMWMNAMAAIAVGRDTAIGVDGAVEALEAFHPLPMRVASDDGGGVRVVNDALQRQSDEHAAGHEDLCGDEAWRASG